jgi:hypothetical protein
MTSSSPYLAQALAGLQVAEVIASVATPTATRARLDRLGIPPWMRSALPAIKITMSAGLLVGPRRPRIGVAAAAAMVGFYTAAIGFHRFSGDPIFLALPAAAFAAGAADCFLSG